MSGKTACFGDEQRSNSDSVTTRLGVTGAVGVDRG
jgi:hypothetical protein